MHTIQDRIGAESRGSQYNSVGSERADCVKYDSLRIAAAVSFEQVNPSYHHRSASGCEVANEILSFILDKIVVVPAADSECIRRSTTDNPSATGKVDLTAERREILIAEERWLESSIQDRVKVRLYVILCMAG